MSEGRVGRHPGGGLPLQTSPDEVKEERVITTLEGGLQLPGAGGPPGLASPRPASVEDCGAVREGGGRAVARVACNSVRDYPADFYPFRQIAVR